MSLAVATIPDDPEQLAPWLETQLVGERLGDLVAELTAVHRPASEPLAAKNRLSPHLPAILHGGLRAIPRTVLRSLLREPSLLLELQEAVFLSGGEYWKTVLRPDLLRERTDTLWPKIADTVPVEEPIVPLSLVRPSRPEWQRWLVSFATAAGVMLAIVLGWREWESRQQPNIPVAVAWGWAKGLPTEPDGRQYLNHLADQAEEWTKQRPTNRDELVTRLLEFRTGCGQLLAADHPQLNPAQQRDLLESCQKWSAAIDGLIVKAKSGADPLEVRGEADELVAKLSTALRGRIANQIG